MKKIITILLAALLAVGTVGFSACRKTVGKDEINAGTGENGKLEIVCQEAGFGLDWLKSIGRGFSKKYNIDVVVTSSTNSSEIISNADARQSEYDIIMTVGSHYKLADGGDLADISGVYAATPDGESEPIAKKMNQNIYQRIQREDGKFYSMNWVNSLDGIFYNKTTLDTLFGKEGWALPNTTDELLALCDRIKNEKSDRAYAFSSSTGVPYWDYSLYAWAAQYSGVDTYFDYYDIKYTDGSGNKQTATSYNQLAASYAGREKALHVIETIAKKSNGYMHTLADSMNYLQAQDAFAGAGFRGDNKLCAFIVSGDWMENELSDTLARNPQEIGMLRTPILSEITETFAAPDNTMSDKALSLIVSEVDKNSTLEQVNAALAASDDAKVNIDSIGKATYDRIVEARRVVYTATMDHMMSIPVTAKNMDNAKKFLIYFASDEAGQIYAGEMNGRTFIYGYEPELTDETSFFTRSVREYGDYIPVYTDYSSPYVYNGNLRFLAVNDRYLKFFNGTDDAAGVEEDIAKFWTDNWQTVVNGGLTLG